MVVNRSICTKTKDKFLIQRLKEVASTAPIVEPPSIPEVALPTSVIPKHHIVLFKQSQSYCLEKFSATREWCLKAEETIWLINQKGLVTGLVETMKQINSEALFFARKKIRMTTKFCHNQGPSN